MFTDLQLMYNKNLQMIWHKMKNSMKESLIIRDNSFSNSNKLGFIFFWKIKKSFFFLFFLLI